MTGAFSIGESRGVYRLPTAETVSFISAKPITQTSIVIPGSNNEPMVTIHPEGRLEFGEAYEPNEAARRFWEAVKRFAPSPQERQFGAPLTVRINKELARGEQAEDLLRSALAMYEAVMAGRQGGGHDVGELAGQIRGFLTTEAPR